jgi:predicted ABC-type ATPase
MSEIVILGGPNGAGKTTASRRILPVFDTRQFVNADEIARGLSPYDPEHSALAAGSCSNGCANL